MIGDSTLIGAPHVDRLAIVSRSTVAAPAFIGSSVVLIDSVVLGAVELRYCTLVGVRISGYGRINGRTLEHEDSAIIVRADPEIWHSDTIRIGPHIDWTGVAILGAGRISGHLTIEPCTQPLNTDPYMGTITNATTHKPPTQPKHKFRPLPGEP